MWINKGKSQPISFLGLMSWDDFEHEYLEWHEYVLWTDMIRSIRAIRVQTLSLAALHAEGAEDGGEDSDDEIDDGFPVYFHDD